MRLDVGDGRDDVDPHHGALPPAHVTRATRVAERMPVAHTNVLADDEPRRDDIVTGVIGRDATVGSGQRERSARPLLELVHRDHSPSSTILVATPVVQCS